MTIKSVDARVLTDEQSAETTVLISIGSDEGFVGYGEAVARPGAVKAIVESEGSDGGWDDGIRTLLLGEDPSEPARLREKLKSRTFWSCRTGVGHVALAGVETALWDLAGKVLRQPVWQLIGEQRVSGIRPYATLYHGSTAFSDTLAHTMDALDVVLARGYRAAKVECMPNNAPRPQDTLELVARARDKVGDDFTLLLDVGYRWQDLEDAKPVVSELDQFGLFALEAPFPPARRDEYRRLSQSISTPIATGDQLTASVDFDGLLDSGVSILQAGAARTGVTDMRALACTAADASAAFLPWGWVPTGLSTWANMHMAVTAENVPFVEYRAPELFPSLLRSRLATPDPTIVDGVIEIPTAPGLGVEVDEELVDRLAG